MSLAPIILFVYNRPWHTQQTVEALQKNELAAESDLFIFADGPKTDASEECLDKIKKVRQYIHTIDGFKSITIKEAISNIGLDTSVIRGVSQILLNYKYAIVLEDDIVTHSLFLKYMNDCLVKYHNEPIIYMISGFSCNINLPSCYRKYLYLIHRPSSWGWGIWNDRWEKIEWDKSKYSFKNFTQRQKNLFCRGGNDLFRMFSFFYEKDIMPWDLRFAYTMYNNNALCIYPRYSFVNNIGFDNSGEHCGYMDTKVFTAPTPESYNTSDLPKRLFFNPFVEYRYRQFLKKHQ